MDWGVVDDDISDPCSRLKLETLFGVGGGLSPRLFILLFGPLKGGEGERLADSLGESTKMSRKISTAGYLG